MAESQSTDDGPAAHELVEVVESTTTYLQPETAYAYDALTGDDYPEAVKEAWGPAFREAFHDGVAPLHVVGSERPPTPDQVARLADAVERARARGDATGRRWHTADVVETVPKGGMLVGLMGLDAERFDAVRVVDAARGLTFEATADPDSGRLRAVTILADDGTDLADLRLTRSDLARLRNLAVDAADAEPVQVRRRRVVKPDNAEVAYQARRAIDAGRSARQELARIYDVSPTTVDDWLPAARNAGHDIPKNRAPRPKRAR